MQPTETLSSPSLIENQKTTDEFFRLVAKYQTQMEKYSVQVSTPIPGSLDVFSSLPFENQELALESLRYTTELNDEIALDPAMSSVTNELPLAMEIKMAKIAAKKRGLVFADEGVFDLIDQGDIIELFDARNIQFFRSWSYFQYVSYSLAEMLVYSWNELFIRPSWIIDRLFEWVGKAMQPGARVIPFEVPPYVVTERLLTRNRSLMFQMKNGVPLLDEKTGEYAGFLVTGSVKILPGLQIGMNIDII